MKQELCLIAGMGVSFGAWCIYLGHNSVVIGSVFALLGTIGGYIIGKRA